MWLNYLRPSSLLRCLWELILPSVQVRRALIRTDWQNTSWVSLKHTGNNIVTTNIWNTRRQAIIKERRRRTPQTFWFRLMDPWWLTSNFQWTGFVMEPMNITDCLGIKENCSGSSSIRLKSCAAFANWFGCGYDILVWRHLEPCTEWPGFDQSRSVKIHFYRSTTLLEKQRGRKKEGGGERRTRALNARHSLILYYNTPL